MERFKKKARHLYKSVVNLIIFAATLPILLVLRLLPIRAGVLAARLLADFLYKIDPRHKKVVLENLEMALGKDIDLHKREALARGCYRHLAISIMEILKLPYSNAPAMQEILQCDDISLLKESFAKGKGLLLITGHIGNWELLGAALCAYGLKLTVVARALKNFGFDWMVTRNRRRAGLKVIKRKGMMAAKQVIRALKNGDVVCMLIDQDTKVKGVFVEFFDKPSHTPAGAAEIALKTGVDIFFIVSFREDVLKHRAFIKGPIKLPEDIEQQQAVIELSQCFNDFAEQAIRQHPQQWVWMHQRWKTKPK